MWPNQQDTADLVTFTEEILNGKLHFLCTDIVNQSIDLQSDLKELILIFLNLEKSFWLFSQILSFHFPEKLKCAEKMYVVLINSPTKWGSWVITYLFLVHKNVLGSCTLVSMLHL